MVGTHAVPVLSSGGRRIINSELSSDTQGDKTNLGSMISHLQYYKEKKKKMRQTNSNGANRKGQKQSLGNEHNSIYCVYKTVSYFITLNNMKLPSEGLKQYQ